MKLYICANGYTEAQINEALRVVEILNNLNHECSIHEHPDVNDFTAEDSDLIVSLGGDGALLNAGKIALKADKPLLGINAGRVGHLCAIGIGDIDNFNEIFENCEIQYRSILHYAFFQKGVIRGFYWWYLPPIICTSLAVLGFMLVGYYGAQD